MLDFTGANTVAYIMRVVKDAVARNPRFHSTLGEVTFASNNAVFWNDVQVTVNRISSQGVRLSPDYFMCTQHGRAIVAKVTDKEGSFIEWAIETDPTRQTPDSGVYYFNIDAVNEQTRDINVTVHRYKWREGSLTNASGTIVTLASGIDGTTLTGVDSANGNATMIFQAFQNFLYLLSPCTTLVLKQGATVLTPLVDYWYERERDYVLINSTQGGSELANIPFSFLSVTLVDQDGYVLRPQIDYVFQGPQWIMLSNFSPAGSQITVKAICKFDPSTTVGTLSENILQIDLQPGETVVNNQFFIHTTNGNVNTSTINDDGTATLSTLLTPGQYVQWEARIDTGQFTAVGKKYELNGFKQTIWDPEAGEPVNGVTPGAFVLKLDDNKQPIDAIPGLALAIGDSVVVGDQVAIIVSPSVTETYQVYGSKDNVTFTLECKSNDLQTSSDLSELLKQELLIFRRTNMESDGITILEASRENKGQQRDNSGTAATYTFDLSVTAMADWKVYVPVVTRVTSFEINSVPGINDFQGKLQAMPRAQTLGSFQFLRWYA